MIHIEGLTKRFGDKVILDSANLSLPDRGLYLISGENGSGKTTLFNLLSLMDRDYSGSIAIDGVDTAELTASKFREFRSRHIAYVFQKDFFLDFDRTDGMEGQLSRETTKSRKLRSLSKGESEALAIDEALRTGAPIVLLDEALRGLSMERRKEYLWKLKEASRNRLILLIAHDPLVEDSVENVLAIRDGKITSVKTSADSGCESAAIRARSASQQRLRWMSVLRDWRRDGIVHAVAAIMMVWIGLVGAVFSLMFRPDMAAMIEKYIAPAEGLMYELDTADPYLVEKYPEDARLNLYFGSLFLDDSVPDDGTFHVRSTEVSGDGIQSIRYRGFLYSIPETTDDSLPDLWRVEANPNIVSRLKGMGDFSWYKPNIELSDYVVESPGGNFEYSINELYSASRYGGDIEVSPGQMVVSPLMWDDSSKPDRVNSDCAHIWFRGVDDVLNSAGRDLGLGDFFPEGFDLSFSNSVDFGDAVISDEDYERLVSAATASYAVAGQTVRITAQNRHDVARIAANERAELEYSSLYYMAYGDVVGYPDRAVAGHLKAPGLLWYTQVTDSDLFISGLVSWISVALSALLGIGYGVAISVFERKNSRIFRLRGESPLRVAAMYGLADTLAIPIYGLLVYLLSVVVSVFSLPDVFPIPSFSNIASIVGPMLVFLLFSYLTIIILLVWKDRRRRRRRVEGVEQWE